jgi:hypothetical protein
MNRFSETNTYASSAHAYYREHGEMPPAESSAVNECENCERACETLHHVPEFNFMGCDTCLDECMTIIAAERAATICAADRRILDAARKSVGHETLATREPARFTVVDRWNGDRWIEVRLEWDGTAYKEAA